MSETEVENQNQNQNEVENQNQLEVQVETPKVKKTPEEILLIRLSQQTKKKNEAEAEKLRLQSELETYKALLNKEAPAQKEKQYTEEEVKKLAIQEAEKLAELHEFNKNCNEVFKQGQQKFGNEWNQAVENLRDLNIISGSLNDHLLKTILETDEPADILKYLSEDPDEAIKISTLSPVKAMKRFIKIQDEIKTNKSNIKSITNVPESISPVKGNVQPNITFLPICQKMNLNYYIQMSIYQQILSTTQIIR